MISSVLTLTQKKLKFLEHRFKIIDKRNNFETFDLILLFSS